MDADQDRRAEPGWSKRAYLEHVRSVIGDVLAGYGFEPVAGSPVFLRKQATDVQASIGIQTISAKLPSSVVSVDVHAGLHLIYVARLCEGLFGRSQDTAVIGGPIGRFTSRNEALTEYRFDWLRPEAPQFARFAQDVASFSGFAAGILGPAELSRHRLARLPGLRRNFADGLGETYRFTVPEVAAVIHQLNGDADAARGAFEVVRTSASGRLTPEQRRALASFLGLAP